MTFDWSVIWDGRYQFLKGVETTVFLTVATMVLAIPGGLLLAFLRFGIAALTLLIALKVRDGSFGWPGRDAIAIMGLGALGFGVYQFMWSIALLKEPLIKPIVANDSTSCALL